MELYKQLARCLILASVCLVIAITFERQICYSLATLKNMCYNKISEYNIPSTVKIPRNLTNISELPITGQNRSIWSDDPECKRFTVKFSSGLPLVWLVSYPRSGNSWTRYLIEAATGVYTNSIYHDTTMVKLGYYGEKEKVDTGRCIITKTHLTFEPGHLKQGKDQHTPTILLIRNPAKSIKSYWSFKTAQSSNRMFHEVENSSYSSKEFRGHANKGIQLWKEVTEDRLMWSRNLLIIPYEKLKDNPIEQVHRILDFLGLQEDPVRMACLAKNIDGKAKRIHKEVDPFTEAEKKKMMLSIEVITRMAELRNITLPDYANMLNITA